MTTRALNYYFGSVLETRFFFYGDEQVYDSRTGTVIRDFVRVLKTNSRPDSNLPLDSDITMRIIAQPVQPDGYVDDYQVLVSWQDKDADGVPDNPDFFDEIVAPYVAATTKLVFFQKIVDFDDLERYVLVASGIVNDQYATFNDITLEKAQYVVGQVFYAYTDKLFYILSSTTSGTTVLVATTEPTPPTIDALSTEYAGLQDYKMISDNMIVNPVKFKPLFGAKAAEQLRATIKVIRASNSTASISEIKSTVVANLDAYFAIENWDFGDVFYFSELSAYLHQRMGDIVSSVVLVPINLQKSFGDLYEIRSAPNEIFVNAATVVDIQVIEALTSTNLRTAPGSGVI